MAGRIRKKYVGDDRALIESTIKRLQAMLARDLIALDPKLTTAISTRALMLDDPNSAPDPVTSASTHPLVDSVVALLDHLEALLLETIIV